MTVALRVFVICHGFAQRAVICHRRVVSTAVSQPLWQLLQSTATVLIAVRAGNSWATASIHVQAALRPGVQSLGFAVLRNLGRAQALREQLARRTPPPDVDALLCCALALAWDPATAPYEPFTLVDQAVEAAKRNLATRAQASFVNACLRRFLRQRDDLVAATDADPVARYNHPRWWIAATKRDHPTQWQAILQANNQQPPLTLRVNKQKVPLAQYLIAQAAMNIEAKQVAESGLQLLHARPVQQLPGFEAGHFSVQDAAAQLAAPLLLTGLAASGPLRVLDACAAPGGKTAHLLEQSTAEQPVHVFALDIDPLRCQRIHENLARLGLSATVVAADALQPTAWWDGQPFDAILLDAPCTASGIVRRHPDVRWLRRETDIAQLAQVQASLLRILWSLVRPGGRLLYCTCSVFLAEGQAQIQTFLAHHTDAVLSPSPGHLLPQNPQHAKPLAHNDLGEHDGFFYALLEKLPSL